MSSAVESRFWIRPSLLNKGPLTLTICNRFQEKLSLKLEFFSIFFGTFFLEHGCSWNNKSTVLVFKTMQNLNLSSGVEVKRGIKVAVIPESKPM